MIRRPKPTDSEADLREQGKFLASGTQSTVNLIVCSLKPKENIWYIDYQPDELSTLTPAPPKKSCFKAEHVRFEDEDSEERLDRHDMHTSAVLTKNIVSDTLTIYLLLSRATQFCLSQQLPLFLHSSRRGTLDSVRWWARGCIHQENQAKLHAMSKGEILEEQKRLLGQLGRPKLLFGDLCCV
uniref:RPAP1 N-terminal domain-containing protein n=1 Tax=Salmo trutta TaxID=8032 RepID=A0A674EGA0_SALTR